MLLHHRCVYGAAFALLLSGAWLAAAPPAAAQGDPLVPPRLLNGDQIGREIDARYPPAMRENGTTGDVLLRFRVLPDSTVDASTVTVESASDSAFVAPATSLTGLMRFVPATVRGTPAPVWIRHVVHFQPREELPSEGYYALAEVEEMTRLRNAADVARQIAAGYPLAQRDSGIVGDVVVRFRVMENGTVNPETLTVEMSTHPAFEAPTASVVRGMRFTPARVGGRPVKVWVTLPIHFGLVPQP